MESISSIQADVRNLISKARLHIIKGESVPINVSLELGAQGINVNDIEMYDNSEELLSNG